MAVATKTITSLLASTTNTAGSTQTSSDLDLATSLGATIVARVVNGATGPTIGCDVIVEFSSDGGTTWFEATRSTAGVASAGSYDFTIGVRPDVKRARVRFTGNTAQSVTVQAHAHVLDSVG